jgi:hypothetical protein
MDVSRWLTMGNSFVIILEASFRHAPKRFSHGLNSRS